MTAGWTTLHYDGLLDLRHTLESGQAFRWRLVRSHPLGDHYEGVVFGNLLRVRQEGSQLFLHSVPDPPEAIAPLLADYLGLDRDLERVYADLNSDDIVARSIADYPGMRILRQDPWECLVSFICSANNNIARITQNVEDIASSLGRVIPSSESERRSFPNAAVVAEAGETALRELGLGFRAKYLASAATAVAEAAVDLFALREAPYDEGLESITGLAGVGDKVGNCVLLFSLDKLEAFPVDVWIDRALREWYFTDSESKSMPRTRMREWAQSRFGPNAGYANQYLFHSRRLEGRRS